VTVEIVEEVLSALLMNGGREYLRRKKGEKL
jgi:hypothetical protein